ncbi:hypothetical protein KFK09_007919 [Dendrobium nobile]|uniref:No apical meristem-associated C-terminal domain-containing protein n=1 Tax=Dendrobium nobile TaxID=94219 RepID=A0A8T3BYH3_DENNO|nr:hypothetical protein KFK09_007919 [Dendrobium nobile]
MSSFGYASSESENLTPESGKQQSPEISTFSLNLDDEEYSVRSSQSERPIGVKKAKLKRKIDDEMSTFIKTLEDGIKELIEQLKRTSAQRQQYMELQAKNYVLKEIKEENKERLQPYCKRAFAVPPSSQPNGSFAGIHMPMNSATPILASHCSSAIFLKIYN